jgi:hypothetical protein
MAQTSWNPSRDGFPKMRERARLENGRKEFFCRKKRVNAESSVFHRSESTIASSVELSPSLSRLADKYSGMSIQGVPRIFASVFAMQC